MSFGASLDCGTKFKIYYLVAFHWVGKCCQSHCKFKCLIHCHCMTFLSEFPNKSNNLKLTITRIYWGKTKWNENFPVHPSSSHFSFPHYIVVSELEVVALNILLILFSKAMIGMIVSERTTEKIILKESLSLVLSLTRRK